MNKLNIIVSLFENYSDTTPKDINLYQLLTSSQYKNLVDKIRAEPDVEKQKKLKSKLPCLTPSGTFKGSADKDLIKHSGLICLDIDEKDNPGLTNFKDLKQLVKTIPYIAYCGVSVRGAGYFVIIPISNTEMHRAHYTSLEMDFKRCGIVIDSACKNVGRKRFVSYDPSPYLNLNAETYSFIAEPQNASKTFGAGNKVEEMAEIATEVARIISVISSNQIDISGGYMQWFELGCSLANTFGDSGREMYHAISQYSASYDYDVTDRKYDECLKGNYKYSIGTFFHYAKQYGITAMLDFSNI